MTYGEKIRTLRLAQSLTQEQLGTLCGYHADGAQKAVERWEADKMYPNIRLIRKLSEALKVPLEDLIP